MDTQKTFNLHIKDIIIIRLLEHFGALCMLCALVTLEFNTD